MYVVYHNLMGTSVFPYPIGEIAYNFQEFLTLAIDEKMASLWVDTKTAQYIVDVLSDGDYLSDTVGNYNLMYNDYKKHIESIIDSIYDKVTSYFKVIEAKEK